MRLAGAWEVIPMGGGTFLQEWIILGLGSCFESTLTSTLDFFRHEQVWSPAGGWWPTPVAWKRNTAVAYLCIGVISSMIFKVSAEKERRPIEPFKPVPLAPSSSEPALVQAPACFQTRTWRARSSVATFQRRAIDCIFRELA
ncbi:hypothetical protein THAOC_21888 [Thalassiosira oceanica]|uniref:Uncharacterized protein n=1 Tax=Thalassiosira oceanica TaxID=159749 RepID=K0RZV2_THAOC|nr:hypothetical protein THAOC_21888 [Thalassiosira oceanica]|eukprot:EJK58014.1 hypothetical protein THAOC_21888 [Thalassiosira oceanica]